MSYSLQVIKSICPECKKECEAVIQVIKMPYLGFIKSEIIGLKCNHCGKIKRAEISFIAEKLKGQLFN